MGHHHQDILNRVECWRDRLSTVEKTGYGSYSGQAEKKHRRRKIRIMNITTDLSEALKRIEELEHELEVSNGLLKDRDALLNAIPLCPAHGLCFPHALEWIEQVKTLSRIISGL